LVVHFYFDTSLGERTESGRRDRKLIDSGWQRQNAKRTVGARNGFLPEIGLHIRGYDARATDHGLRTVAHHTQN
jgi:hypothetical protein